MADVMAQRGYGLSAPASRQDVISALLNEYGTSFGRGHGPSSLSPTPAEKELPPPPPPDSPENKPLPAVQRAEQRMGTKFQLRVIEDAPLSPSSPHQDSLKPRRKKILYRSLSRDAKPPSLNLLVSNGSTAVIPPTPVLSSREQHLPSASSFEDKRLPSPPPPPPEKSARRSQVQRKPMSLQQSKPQTDLARNDSLLSNDETKPSLDRPATVEAVSSVKRKALPAPAVKKFVGLAQLGAGPRGGKGGPLPPTSVPRKKSVDNQVSSDYHEPETKVSKEQQQLDTLSANQMPPTPEEDKAPVPPRKIALGLPSNPRAREGPISPKHVRGKSSTGFGLLKAQRPAPPIPTKAIETLTPEMTPSPTLKPEQLTDNAISPLSPLPPTEQTRPFSFEPISTPVPPKQTAEQPNSALPVITPPSVTVPPEQSESPIRPSSADLSDSFSPATTSTPTPAPHNLEPSVVVPVPVVDAASNNTAPVPVVDTVSNNTAPVPVVDAASNNTAPVPVVDAASNEQEAIVQPSSVSNTHPALTEKVGTPPPFEPLTRAPIPLPQTLIPAITPAHLSCYTNHKNITWSNNSFHPMGCMICLQNDRDRKWCCTWCQLRICTSCSQELCQVPRRNLETYLLKREKMMEGNESIDRGRGPETVLSAVYERDEDFS